MQKEPKKYTETYKVKSIMDEVFRTKKELPVAGIKSKNGENSPRTTVGTLVIRIQKNWFENVRFYTRERDGIIYIGVADAEN